MATPYGGAYRGRSKTLRGRRNVPKWGATFSDVVVEAKTVIRRAISAFSTVLLANTFRMALPYYKVDQTTPWSTIFGRGPRCTYP